MNKVWLIIQREFLTRVRKKSFLIVTIVVPLIIPAIIGGLFMIMMNQIESAKPDTVMVVDESLVFNLDSAKNTKRFLFVPLQTSLERAKTVYTETKDFALLYIPKFDINKPEGIALYTQENQSIEKIGDLVRILEERVRDLKLEQYKIDKEVLKNLRTDIRLKQISLSKTGEEKSSNAMLKNGLGFLLGIMIYIFVLVYGIQIMQGVIDEKTSKVVEVIVSSVRPFQLMLGKILGIAGVGVLQFLIWIVLTFTLSSAVLTYFGLKMPQKQMMEQVTKKMQDENIKQAINQPNNDIKEFFDHMEEIPVLKIASVFLFYFLGGYLLYGALFAAVGSAVESMQESQQFQFPITVPLLIGYLGLFMFILRDPHGPVSFWLSIIPFTSPVAMVGRIAFDVPTWQLILSMVLLVGGFIFTTWVAGRIYRVGILMTGTKINWKVMAKWFMMRE